MQEQSQNSAPNPTPRELAVINAEPQVLSIRFSPCGKHIAAGGYDGRIHRWDVSTDEPRSLPPLEAHRGWVSALAFATQSANLFSVDSWGGLCAWELTDDAANLAWKHEAAHDGWVRDLCLSPDGKHLATCGRDRFIRVWSTLEGAPVWDVSHEFDVFCVRYHPEGQRLVVGDERGGVHVLSANNGRFERDMDARLLYLHDRLQDVGGVRTLSFDEHGQHLAVGGTVPKNGATVQGIPTVLLFDFESGEVQQRLGFGPPNHCFAHEVILHPDGYVIVVTSGTPGQGQFILQRPEDEQPFYTHTKIANCQSLSWHAGSQRLAVMATNRGSNGNGRRLSADGQYLGNQSPIHIFELAPSA